MCSQAGKATSSPIEISSHSSGFILKKKKKDITEIMERNGMGNRKLEILWMWGREGWNLRISFLVNLLINFCKYVVSLIVLENISRF